MNLWTKFKNAFTEEVEEDTVEIKVEQILNTKVKPKKVTPKVEIEEEENIEVEKTAPIKPVKEEVEEEIESITAPIEIEERPTREKTKAPLFFDEDDFEDIEKSRPVKKVEPKKEEVKKVEERPREKERETKLYGGSYTQGSYTSTSILTQEKPTFKPTPIISPIYGILDKNYSKDDIVEKTDKSSYTTSPTRRDKFDEVRNKAYGKLEDEVEDVIYYPEEQEEIVEKNVDLFDELEKREAKEIKLEDTAELSETVMEQEKNIKELEEITMDLTKELDNLLLKKDSFNDKKERIERESNDAQLTENELFNLIDSMYEEGKE